MDEAIGRIIDEIDKLGLRDNTLLYSYQITEPSGAPKNLKSNANLRGRKALYMKVVFVYHLSLISQVK